jgi:2',3'-cyclic-nucleotide 2'-phosphodiesterase (5'-nucleotidase family)
VILSTTDVKGKTNPCGCHTPKGGLARQASYIDSMRTTYGQVLLVDNGGFFPEDSHDDIAAFLMGAMKTMGYDVAGLGERDLRFGVAFLKSQLTRSGLPMVCSNLIETPSGKPLVQRSIVKKVGTVKVGLFSLIGDQADLGPAKDSLKVAPARETARQMVADLRKKGADVVVLLSQLGKVETEDLVAEIQGIDAAIAGKNVPMLQKGRMIGKTVVCYGGEQGQYLCQTQVVLDAKRRMVTGEGQSVMMGPEIADKPEIKRLVSDFEAALAARAKKAEPGQESGAVPPAPTTDK